ncbi:HAD family hydrolase [Pedobacter metabolipauper]|uniref:Putative hydrolase of the HAD superfamily n=1 Tax=Pedobacter metabolipauper TaxID=425513 RepID=A0A4R6SYH8_9SPHI|nr:HAD hydrolase-like protein [Pedobacter metabolipauper]TDQ11055.1 putative hydrolase of the HAD superfamily [Pedobacter metabolipauper]
MNDQQITTLFTDIGGVLLTNGWDRAARAEAAQRFHLDLVEVEERHHLTFDTYEVGKISLDEYLDRLVFYEERHFDRIEFKEFMFSKSLPYNDMIELICGLKKKYNLKVAVISNEGRELNQYRINTFRLNEFIDFFISSSFVHFRKPDADIFKVAIDISQSDISRSIYIDDRMLFVQIAEGLGVRGIYHTSYEDTKKKLEEFGLTY